VAARILQAAASNTAFEQAGHTSTCCPASCLKAPPCLLHQLLLELNKFSHVRPNPQRQNHASVYQCLLLQPPLAWHAHLASSATAQPGTHAAHIRWHQPPSDVTFMAPPTQGHSVHAGGWVRSGSAHTSHSQDSPWGWLCTP
jgi:hypothetical protein